MFVHYNLSPEARYPIALEQVLFTAQWVVAHGARHGLDGSRLAVAGDSAGGNLTAALTLLSQQRGGPRCAAQVLFCPVTDAAFDTRSYSDFAEGYFLTRQGMRWFWDQYTTDPRQRAESTVSPLRAPAEQMAGLPPALVITAEADVVRGRGVRQAAPRRGRAGHRRPLPGRHPRLRHAQRAARHGRRRRRHRAGQQLPARGPAPGQCGVSAQAALDRPRERVPGQDDQDLVHVLASAPGGDPDGARVRHACPGRTTWPCRSAAPPAASPR